MAQQHRRQKTPRQRLKNNDVQAQSDMPETHITAVEKDIEVLEEVQYVIEEEYEQLKRRNRRRLVGSGALVLVAAGLFAGATTSKNLSPKLVSAQNPASQQITTEILRPKNATASSVVYDIQDAAGTTAVLQTGKNGKIIALTANEKAAQDARLQREKAQRLATRRKQEAERQQQAQQLTNTTSPQNNLSSTTTTKTTTPADNKRKIRDDEQRRRKTQELANKAEAERAAKEAATAEKARQAQLAADKARNAERAKLVTNTTLNTTGSTSTSVATSNETARIQQEKQRAQRIAAEREKKSKQIVIQAGSFLDKTQAQKMQQQLKSMNYNSGIEEVQTAKGTVYRVKTGKFANKAEADNALKNLKDKGVKGMIVGQ